MLAKGGLLEGSSDTDESHTSRTVPEKTAAAFHCDRICPSRAPAAGWAGSGARLHGGEQHARTPMLLRWHDANAGLVRPAFRIVPPRTAVFSISFQMNQIASIISNATMLLLN